jgi:hypothetical protein
VNWPYSPSLPTEPGLYVTTTFDVGSKPLLIRWHAKSEFADVEHLFDAPVSTRTNPTSRARAFGQRRDR